MTINLVHCHNKKTHRYIHTQKKTDLIQKNMKKNPKELHIRFQNYKNMLYTKHTSKAG